MQDTLGVHASAGFCLPSGPTYMYADQIEHERGEEDSILRERLSRQDATVSYFRNLAISSFDESESSENLNGKLECEPTACLSTGI